MLNEKLLKFAGWVDLEWIPYGISDGQLKYFLIGRPLDEIDIQDAPDLTTSLDAQEKWLIGDDWDISWFRDGASGYNCLINVEGFRYPGNAKTRSGALALAVEKLIDSEVKE